MAPAGGILREARDLAVALASCARLLACYYRYKCRRDGGIRNTGHYQTLLKVVTFCRKSMKNKKFVAEKSHFLYSAHKLSFESHQHPLCYLRNLHKCRYIQPFSPAQKRGPSVRPAECHFALILPRSLVPAQNGKRVPRNE